MFKIKDGKLELNRTHRITPKQQARLARLPDERRDAYMMSLLGLSKSRITVNKFERGQYDELAYKPKNSVLSKLNALRNVDNDHVPNNYDVGGWIGVEIECFIPHEEGGEGGYCTDECDHDNDECYATTGVWSEREAHKWLKAQLSEAKISRVSIKSDGSLSDDDGHGVEVTITFNSNNGFEPLEKLCKILNDLGCYVNKTCGLHVHLDARHLDKNGAKKLGRSIGNTLDVVKWMVPESRHNNNYCKLGVSRFKGARYYAVNLTSFRKHRTIEIRLHSGSCAFDKIKNWIELLKLIGSARITSPVLTFQDLIDAANIPDHLVEYVERRITELNPSAWSKLNPASEPLVVQYSMWPRVEGLQPFNFAVGAE